MPAFRRRSNLGLIDACISKQQNNFDKVLQETVEKCQESYFVALSKYVEVFFSPMDRKKSALYSEEFRTCLHSCSNRLRRMIV
jgi:hypothetical protein